ncbi:MAG: FdhF/YdeP family oxidoreductase [Gemmatimonadaceae bacterium]|nr:FdhF/YdeP family oxidoreductase [Acetobacteraceae bacterium]
MSLEHEQPGPITQEIEARFGQALPLTRRGLLGTVSAAAALSSVPLLAGCGAGPGGTELGEVSIKPYDGPSGGWGSIKSVATVLRREGLLATGPFALLDQNKPHGFKCVSCAWAKPADHHPAEFCENGAKATAWEITSARCTPEFFAAHTCKQLEAWSDHDLEKQGRLTHPLRWDKASDKYVQVSWEAAFAEIGQELTKLDPKTAVFYASGRAALETSYMWQLFARMYGSNNMPDSSNMCHESTSVGLPDSIGSGVGTITHDDFKTTDCLFYLGHNLAVNSPRMLHDFQEVRKRGVPIVTINPLLERGMERFTNPQSPVEMLTGAETTISTQYLLVKAGADTAALAGICKALIEADDQAKAAGRQRVLDVAFIADHTHGFDAFASWVRQQAWTEIERQCGLTTAELQAAARTYAGAERVMGLYGMGITQHTKGTQTVQMLVNFLLLRGNMGRPGAGICPVRGHSNVQGQRTVGITEKPELAPLDKFEEQYGFKPPRYHGMATVEACEAILKGEVKAFVALGGNFIRAIPDTAMMEDAWRRLPLTVQVATKLNRNHVIHGEVSFVLPCLGRIEVDRQASGEQAVSMEDSTAHFHGSRGYAAPASEALLSEPRIVAELAKATLAPNPRVPWDGWVADYSTIRASMEETWPVMFKDYNKQLWTPGGFARPVAARKRQWHTKTGRANFIVPDSLVSDTFSEGRERADVMRLITTRSNDQFNTTVYGYSDRFRGVEGTRQVVFMNVKDIARLGFKPADVVTLATVSEDGVTRELAGLRIVPYVIADGCIAAYFPECNVLVPIWHHDERAMTPAVKSVPVRMRRT